MSHFRTPENPENDSSIAVKRKLRFPIGEYARQRKMARVQAAKEMADTDKVVDNLRKKLSYRKQKVSCLIFSR